MDREEQVRVEIERLRHADEAQLITYNEELTKKRRAWFIRKSRDSTTLQGDPVTAAYQLLLSKFGISREEMPIVERSRNKIVFHSVNFCSTLEACKSLGLDTRTVCRLYNEKATDALIKQIDPALRFTRNYDRLRPHAPYCEEMIIRDIGDD